MNLTKKKILLTSSIIVLLISFSLYLKYGHTLNKLIVDMAPSKNQFYKEIREKIQTVKLGMSKDEVKKIMGEPLNIGEYNREGKSYEVWTYPFSIVAAESCYCLFNNEIVVEVVGGENYHLKQK